MKTMSGANDITGSPGIRLITIPESTKMIGKGNLYLLLSNPRVMYAMSMDGILPAAFKKKDEEKDVLTVSLTVFAAMCVIVLFFADTFDKILSFTIFLDSFGMAFSAATIFISNLKGQKNTTLIGEETGGGYYGSSAMYLPTITLPNSRLRVTLPMYRLVMDSTRPKGHGIVPDIEIPPSSVAIKEGIDVKMKKIREMIQQKTL